MEILSGFLWLVSLALPWIWSLGLALLPRKKDGLAGIIACAGAGLTALSVSASLLLKPADGSMQAVLEYPWFPDLGLESLFVRDGLTSMFALTVSWISASVILYSLRYLAEANAHEKSNRRQSAFYSLMSAFTGSMLGLVSSGNLLQLYFFWELTGIASYLLIGYWHRLETSRRGALSSLIMTVAGGMAMLVGFLWLGGATGQWAIGSLTDHPLAFTGPWMEGCAVLIILGALAKSAQFPFINWLPGAMAAPTPVSAFLHSSALVAAGIYLMARFFPLLHATQAWWWALVVPGIVGATYCGLIALRQKTIKGLLAYSTISQYAFMFLGLGLGTVTGVQAALYAFFVHAFIKAGLFLIGGAVTYLTGKKELEEVGGIGRTHWVLAVLGVALGFSLGGIPIMGGFYYKEELLHAALLSQSWLLFSALLLGGMFSLMYMLRFLGEIFIGPGDSGTPYPLPVSMGIPILAMGLLALLTAVFPNWMNRLVLDPAIESAVGVAAPLAVELEIGGTFLLSLGVLSLGALLWLLWRNGIVPYEWWLKIPRRFAMGGNAFISHYGRLAERLLDLHGGDLRHYVRRMLAVFLGIFAVAWIPWFRSFNGHAHPQAVDPMLALLLCASVLSAVSIVLTRRHLVAVLALTVTGYSLAGAFLLMRAPNVAMAQALVETLAAISILIALRTSRRVDPVSTDIEIEARGGWEWKRMALSVGVGLAVAFGVYAARLTPPDAVGQWYAAEGHTLTGKDDFVAAILTDFRGLDTVIEILVFATAMLGAMGLTMGGRTTHE